MFSSQLILIPQIAFEVEVIYVAIHGRVSWQKSYAAVKSQLHGKVVLQFVYERSLNSIAEQL